MLDKKSKAGESNLPAKGIASTLSGTRRCRNRALGTRRGGYLPSLLVYNRWKAGDYLGRRGTQAGFPHVVPATLWADWRLACRSHRGEGLLDGAWACDVPAKPPHGIVGDYVAKPAHQERRELIALLATAAFWSILVWCLALAWIANKDEGCDGCTANFERDIRWALLKTEARTVARAEAPRGAD